MTDPSTRRRPRGEGTIYQSADGRWRAALTVLDRTGQPRRRYVSGPTMAAVRDRLDELRLDRATGAAAVGARPTTVRAFLLRWAETTAPRVRPATARNYRNAVARILPVLGDVRLADLRTGDVEAALASLVAPAGPYQPTTVALVRRILVLALNDAARDGLVARNVASLARTPRDDRPRRRGLEAADVRAILAATADHRLGPLVAFAVATGARRGELVALRRSDHVGGQLRVRGAMSEGRDGRHRLAAPKTPQSARPLDLSPLANAALEREAAWQDAERAAAGVDWHDHDAVFADPLGAPITPDHVSARYGELVRRLGLPAHRFHDLRHAYASLALSAGEPVADVAAAMGHASPTVTMSVYAHVLAGGPRRVSDAVATALREPVLGDG